MNLVVTHSKLPLQTEKKVDAGTTVGQLKDRLYPIVGTAPHHMTLVVRDRNGNTVKTMGPDDATLAALGVQEYDNVHVVDTDASNALLAIHDTSGVDKYEMPDHEYDKLDHTFRKWKQTLNRPERPEPEIAPKGMAVDQRCIIDDDTDFPKRGRVAYIGPIKSKAGEWVGIELDEPYGKNDGSVHGRVYFQANRNYGIFKRASKVRVGDFPPLDDEI